MAPIGWFSKYARRCLLGVGPFLSMAPLSPLRKWSLIQKSPPIYSPYLIVLNVTKMALIAIFWGTSWSTKIKKSHCHCQTITFTVSKTPSERCFREPMSPLQGRVHNSPSCYYWIMIEIKDLKTKGKKIKLRHVAFSVSPINQPFFFSKLQIGGRGQPRDNLWCHLVSGWVLKSSSCPMSEKTSDSLSSGPNA